MLKIFVNHMTLDVFHSRVKENPVAVSEYFFVSVTAAYLCFLECLVSTCILPNIINFIENKTKCSAIMAKLVASWAFDHKFPAKCIYIHYACKKHKKQIMILKRLHAFMGMSEKRLKISIAFENLHGGTDGN